MNREDKNMDPQIYIRDNSLFSTYLIPSIISVPFVGLMLFIVYYVSTPSSSHPADGISIGPISLVLSSSRTGGYLMLAGCFLILAGVWSTFPARGALNNYHIRNLLKEDVDCESMGELHELLIKRQREFNGNSLSEE